MSLEQDAEWIRSQQEKGQDAMLAIAERLQKVQKREKWTTRELAEWCAEEQLGFDTHARVVQILGYARTVKVLEHPGTQANEKVLRPLTVAINQGMSEDQARAVWGDLTVDDEEVAQEDVHQAVSKSLWGKQQRAAQKKRDTAHNERVDAEHKRRKEEPTEEESAQEIIDNRQDVFDGLVEAVHYANDAQIWDPTGLTKSEVKRWRALADVLYDVIDNMERNLQ